jgi:hypothetical protein
MTLSIMTLSKTTLSIMTFIVTIKSGTLCKIDHLQCRSLVIKLSVFIVSVAAPLNAKFLMKFSAAITLPDWISLVKYFLLQIEVLTVFMSLLAWLRTNPFD